MTHRKHNRGLAGIAIFKLLQSLFVAGLGVSALNWLGSGWVDQAQEVISALALTSERRALSEFLQTLSGFTTGQVRAIGFAAFGYALLFAIEGVGLWLEYRWAEWLTAIATASFLPFELYEVSHRFSLAAILVLTINLLVVIYLISVIRKGSAARRALQNASAASPDTA